MPFAFIALALSVTALITGGTVVASGGATMASLTPDSFETAAVGVVGLAFLVLLLWPGALVRVLYGRRPAQAPHASVLTAEERAMTRFDKEEFRSDDAA